MEQMTHCKISLLLGAFVSGFERHQSRAILVRSFWDQESAGCSVVRWAVTTKNLRWKELTNFLSLHYKILGKQFAVQNPFRRGRKLHSLKPILKQISLLKSLFLSFSVCACLPETIAFSTVTKIEIEIGWHTQK